MEKLTEDSPGPTVAKKPVGSKPVKTLKVPTNILEPASFLDTVAVLAIFSYVPAFFMLLVHGLFITSFFGTAGLPSRNARALFGWYTTSLSSSSGSPFTSGSSSGPGSWWWSWYRRNGTPTVVLKVLCIDFGLALITLYQMPVFSNIVITFAHAVVAASLGGGAKVFVNAIYGCTLIQAIKVIYDRFYSQQSGFIDHRHSYAQTHGPILPNLGIHSSLPAADRASFNTISSIYSLVRNLAYSIRRMDWMRELPLIFFQAVAIHVIAIGLLTYLRKVFPARTSEITTKITIDDTDTSDLYVANGTATSSLNFKLQQKSGQTITSTANFSHNNSSSNISSITGNIPASVEADEESKRTVISVPGNKSVDADEDGPNLRNGGGGYSDLDFFLYAPVKKNKRLAIVRANQPLWSMLASSIVLAARQESTAASKEEEQERTAQKVGFGRCYVRYILESVIAFDMAGFNEFPDNTFTIRVNGINWPQVTIERLQCKANIRDSNPEESNASADDNKPHFLAVIYGLTPITQYTIEILGKIGERVVMCAKINVSTVPGKDTDSAASSSLTPARPLSPVTTLLDNLATMQMTLSDEKSRLKRFKKEHAKRLTSLRAEIDMIHTKIDTADKGDERNKRKILSLRESVRQLEEEIAKLSQLSSELADQQQECEQKFLEDENAYRSILKELESIEDSESKVRGERRTEYQNLEAELNLLISRRDKQLSKKERTLIDIDRFDNESLEAIDEVTNRRHAERESKLARRAKLQEEFGDAISKMEKGVADLNQRTASLARV